MNKADKQGRSALSHSKLYTSDIRMCGIQLLVNKTYIVTGFVNGSPPKASVSSCGFHVLLDQSDAQIKTGFEGEYKSHCNH